MATPFVVFPGLTGNYASTPNINVLDSDTAHLVQSAGLWSSGAVSTAQAFFGPSSLLVTGGASTAITPPTDAASFSVRVFSAAGDTFDVNGGSPVVAKANTWTRLEAVGPAGTYTISAVGSGDYYVDGACLQASGVVFVPSIRIVGDLDIRVDLAGTDYTPAANATYVGNGSTSLGYHFWMRSDGRLRLNHANGSTREASIVAGLTDGVRYQLRGTMTVATGVFEFFVDGSSVGTPVGATGAGVPSTADLFAGSSEVNSQPFAGSYWTAEVRDGIDGPIVAKFDAVDVGQAIPL